MTRRLWLSGSRQREVPSPHTAGGGSPIRTWPSAEQATLATWPGIDADFRSPVTLGAGDPNVASRPCRLDLMAPALEASMHGMDLSATDDAFVSSPLSPLMPRAPSAEELRVLENGDQAARGALRFMFWSFVTLSALSLAFITLLSTRASSNDLPVIFLGYPIIIVSFGLGALYLRRRLKHPIAHNDLVQPLHGIFRAEQRGSGKTLRVLHFIGPHFVVPPPHWIGTHLRIGDHVVAEGYPIKPIGIDRMVVPDGFTLVTVPGKASLDQDVRNGLLTAKSETASILAIVLAGIGICSPLFSPGSSVIPTAFGTCFVVTSLIAIRNSRFNRRLRLRLLDSKS